jgi:Type II secretory pathway, pseudopilin PulG
MNRKHNVTPVIAPRCHRHSGFTLVEMLVATGLVVLIMSLFAQIYSTAITSITQQRGMGNNDQKARILTQILHNDLSRMTYKQAYVGGVATVPGIVPLAPGDAGTDGESGVLDQQNQRGYFYFSENDPWNSSDDVLQFTAEVSGDNLTVEDLFIGKVATINSPPIDEPATDGVSQDFGQSRFAEISYFLRNGNLYRRVLLLRDMPNPSDHEQPRTDETTRIFGLDNENWPGFWRDFDFSATRVFDDLNDGNMNSLVSSLWFHGKNSLNNTNEDINYQLPLGLPWNRFGHLNDQRPTAIHHGHPREYLNPDEDRFIGRFTHQETSSPGMLYPGNEDFASFNRGFSGTYDYDNDGLTGLTDGDRMGEDILLTNVESFDVEVWDSHEQLMRFVQLGHDERDGDGNIIGHFAQSSDYQNPNYGPRATGNNIFDTWHPQATFGNMANPPQMPPFRPLRVNFDANDPNNEWKADNDYVIGDRIRHPDLTDGSNYSNSWYLEVVRTTTGKNPGRSSDPDGALLGGIVPGEERQDNELVWRCFENRIGLRAIRITIRYIDQQTRIPRQVTVVHSFVR